MPATSAQRRAGMGDEREMCKIPESTVQKSLEALP